MNREALYNRTVDILVQAYFNDTVEHGDCSACAVGNLVCANMGITNVELERRIQTVGGWSWVFCTLESGWGYRYFQNEYVGEAKRQIDATGYSLEELMKIEKAFETASKGKSKEDYMFNGLMNVMDVLDQIHDNTDTSISSQSKQRFSKQAI